MRVSRLFPCLPLLGLLAMPSAQAAQAYDNCTGFINSLPATLSTPGVWCLRQDLATAIASGSAIYVNSNGVTIDCNEFKLGGLAAGVATNTSGIRVYNKSDTTVRRCNLRGFRQAVMIEGGGGHVVEDNRMSENRAMGIHVLSARSVVQRNQVYATGGSPDAWAIYGIYAIGDVIGNTVAGVSGGSSSVYGIFVPDYIAPDGGEVRDNRVRGLVVNGDKGATGIQVQAPSFAITGNRVSMAMKALGGGGVVGDGVASSFCSGNTVSNFTYTITQCKDLGGNASH